jgi:hypothetical protein
MSGELGEGISGIPVHLVYESNEGNEEASNAFGNVLAHGRFLVSSPFSGR